MRKSIFLAAATAAMLSIGSLTAQASPLGASGVSAQAGSPGVVLTAGGCGIGWHRGPLGRCRRNFVRRRIIRRCVIRRGPFGRVRRICRTY
jgi:hypothetical protein